MVENHKKGGGAGKYRGAKSHADFTLLFLRELVCQVEYVAELHQIKCRATPLPFQHRKVQVEICGIDGNIECPQHQLCIARVKKLIVLMQTNVPSLNKTTDDPLTARHLVQIFLVHEVLLSVPRRKEPALRRALVWKFLCLNHPKHNPPRGLVRTTTACVCFRLISNLYHVGLDLQWRKHNRRPVGRLLLISKTSGYFMCAETSFVISNMVTSPLPPKSGLSLSSAKMLRLLAGFWRLFALM